MAKKKTTTKPATDETSSTSEAPEDLRFHGDGAAMLDAKSLAKLHGEETLKQNAEHARRVRAEQGD